jgi:hypothetical protein
VAPVPRTAMRSCVMLHCRRERRTTQTGRLGTSLALIRAGPYIRANHAQLTQSDS